MNELPTEEQEAYLRAFLRQREGGRYTRQEAEDLLSLLRKTGSPLTRENMQIWLNVLQEESVTVTPPSPRTQFAKAIRAKRATVVILASLFLGLLWFGAIRTPQGQAVDTIAMHAVERRIAVPGWFPDAMAEIVSVPTLMVLVVILFVVAFYQQRMVFAARIVLVFALANLATQGIKMLVERPDFGVGLTLQNSLPSGHVTVVASLGVVLIALVPIRLRSWMALLAALATAVVSVAVVAMGWHRPSDVLASLAIVTVFTMMALPTRFVADRHTASRSRLLLVSVILLGLSMAVFFVTAKTSIDGTGAMTSAQIDVLAGTADPGFLLTLATFVALACGALTMVLLADSLAGNQSEVKDSDPWGPRSSPPQANAVIEHNM